MSLLAALILAAAEPPQPIVRTLTNADFRNGTAGWMLDKQSRDGGFRFSAANGTVRIDSALPPKPGELAVATQDLAAGPWRGRRIELIGRVRMAGNGTAGLRLLAVRDTPEARLLRTSVAVPADGQWHQLRLHGRVGPKADRIRLALYAIGPVTADFDDIQVRAWQPPAAAIAPDAQKMLDDGLAFIGSTHFNAKGNPNWPKLEAQARHDAAGAQTRSDVESALTALLGDLDERHAHLVSPQDGSRNAASFAAPTSRSGVTLADGRYGLVTMPTSGGSDLSDTGPARKEVDAVRAGLATLDQRPLCGWIVDLRGNGGGTTQFLANALPGLARFDKKLWPDEFGGDLNELPPSFRWLVTFDQQPLKQGGKPVAVLVDKDSASAAESMALMFVGREPTRSFGEKTAGFTSNNAIKDLGGGWTLAVPVAYMHDRFNRPAKDGITPDVVTPDPLPAAKRWLAGQCGSS